MKGQTAVEYLMTYGWAILIILIVAGVLAYYGIFAPASFVGSSARGFTTVQILQPFTLGADGTLKANVENRAGQDITVDGICIWSLTDAAKHGCEGDTDEAFVPGEKRVVTFGTLASIAGTSGNNYQYEVVINYTYGTDAFTSSGSISGTFA